jgi:CCR4-NOT transcription complex subunit 2
MSRVGRVLTSFITRISRSVPHTSYCFCPCVKLLQKCTQQLPTCYFVNPPALKTGHLSKFTLEILFYIFYGMPKDALQAYAAQELHNREWRYHVEHQLWFKRAVPGDGIDLGDGSPKYIYFDYRSWDRRHFTGSIQDLAQGFLSEDDVRVRIGNSS